jgi:hypothetical protein
MVGELEVSGLGPGGIRPRVPVVVATVDGDEFDRYVDELECVASPGRLIVRDRLVEGPVGDEERGAATHLGDRACELPELLVGGAEELEQHPLGARCQSPRHPAANPATPNPTATVFQLRLRHAQSQG